MRQLRRTSGLSPASAGQSSQRSSASQRLGGVGSEVVASRRRRGWLLPPARPPRVPRRVFFFGFSASGRRPRPLSRSARSATGAGSRFAGSARPPPPGGSLRLGGGARRSSRRRRPRRAAVARRLASCGPAPARRPAARLLLRLLGLGWSLAVVRRCRLGARRSRDAGSRHRRLGVGSDGPSRSRCRRLELAVVDELVLRGRSASPARFAPRRDRRLRLLLDLRAPGPRSWTPCPRRGPRSGRVGTTSSS